MYHHYASKIIENRRSLTKIGESDETVCKEVSEMVFILIVNQPGF